VGQLLGSGLVHDQVPAVVLIGFPSDEGVRRNGGRAGAAEGPEAIRTALYRLTPDPRSGRLTELLGRTRDLGNLEVSGEVETDQEQLGQLLTPYIEQDVFVVVLGGGHETSYGHFRGYVGAERAVEILNWDAHADVRELNAGKAHSGSPFRQALEDRSGRCRRYTVVGLEPHLVSRPHLEYVEQRGRAVWRQDVTDDTLPAIYGAARPSTLVSFDLDAVNQSEAPGVSAPNAAGFNRAVWLEAAYLAGLSAAVTSADIVELNPRYDRDGQTARLAALTVWSLLRGRAER
jgi:formiminoglutamase